MAATEAVVRGSEVAVEEDATAATGSLIEAVCFDKFFPAEDVASESLVSNEMSTRLKCKNWDSGFGGICSFLGVSAEESSDWAKQSQDLENEKNNIINIAKAIYVFFQICYGIMIFSYFIVGFEVLIIILLWK